MKILITGGGGFIGSHLIEHQLSRGHLVRTVDLHTDSLRHLARQPNVEIVTGDITNKGFIQKLLIGIDVVYHLASAHLDVSLSDADYWRVNVKATANLLAAAREVGVTRFVHCSSNGVVGEIQQPPADETTPCHPTNIYEKTKLAGEQAAQQFAHDTAFQVIIARPGWVYGPRCPRTAKLIRTISQGRFVMFGNGRTLRHPIYISDALAGLERCAQADVPPGEIYFLAGEEFVPIRTLVDTIADLLQVSHPRLTLPLALGKVMGVGAQTAFQLINKRPPFSRRSLDFYMKDNAYDISKARRELGFKPTVSLRDGLRETMVWMDSEYHRQLSLRENRTMDTLQATVTAVHDYWNSHTLGLQYVTDKNLEVGSPAFFAHIRPWMNPYKFPWIMERIKRESALLQGKHLLEIGCGMGYDSLEFLKRGVRVTATDLTPNAVEITRRHFEIEGVQAEEIRTADALKLPFADNTFDAVWSNGVLHATGDTALAIQEVRRVLKPGGRAIISHFYRKPSWMYLLHHVGRENIEYKEEDPPVNEFYTEAEILDFFKGYEVVEAVQDHYRALPVRRDGLKAALYKYGFMPVYNLIPEGIAKRLAYKLSVTAVKK